MIKRLEFIGACVLGGALLIGALLLYLRTVVSDETIVLILAIVGVLLIALLFIAVIGAIVVGVARANGESRSAASRETMAMWLSLRSTIDLQRSGLLLQKPGDPEKQDVVPYYNPLYNGYSWPDERGTESWNQPNNDVTVR